MTGFLHAWFSLAGVLVTLAVAVVVCLVWRAVRLRRTRQPYWDRQRQRRRFWGYE